MTALPNPFLSDLSELYAISGEPRIVVSGFADPRSADRPAVASNPAPEPDVAAGSLSVSDDIGTNSVPSGQSEPSVMLACASSESSSDESGSPVDMKKIRDLTALSLQQGLVTPNTTSTDRISSRQNRDVGYVAKPEAIFGSAPHIPPGPSETSLARCLVADRFILDQAAFSEALSEAQFDINQAFWDSEPMPLFLQGTR